MWIAYFVLENLKFNKLRSMAMSINTWTLCRDIKVYQVWVDSQSGLYSILIKLCILLCE